MPVSRIRRHAQGGLAVVACALSALLVAGCGGATSDGGDAASTTVAPLSKTQRVTETATSATSGSSSSAAKAGETSTSGQRQAETPQDREAREVSEVPSAALQLGGREAGYIEALKNQGIQTDGVEDTLIGTASVVCQNQDTQNIEVMILAVAGQLVEQGKTDKTPEDTVAALASAAKSAYC